MEDGDGASLGWRSSELTRMVSEGRGKASLSCAPELRRSERERERASGRPSPGCCCLALSRPLDSLACPDRSLLLAAALVCLWNSDWERGGEILPTASSLPQARACRRPMVHFLGFRVGSPRLPACWLCSLDCQRKPDRRVEAAATKSASSPSDDVTAVQRYIHISCDKVVANRRRAAEAGGRRPRIARQLLADCRWCEWDFRVRRWRDNFRK